MTKEEWNVKKEEEFQYLLDGDLGEHPLLVLLPGELRQLG